MSYAVSQGCKIEPSERERIQSDLIFGPSRWTPNGIAPNHETSE